MTTQIEADNYFLVNQLTEAGLVKGEITTLIKSLEICRTPEDVLASERAVFYQLVKFFPPEDNEPGDLELFNLFMLTDLVLNTYAGLLILKGPNQAQLTLFETVASMTLAE